MSTATKERPILFSAPMVRAILSGAKTQTRRVMTWRNSTVLGYPAKPYWPYLRFDEAVARDKSALMVFICRSYDKAPMDVHLSVPFAAEGDEHIPSDDLGWYRVRPIWEPGDRLWVRETWGDTLSDPPEAVYRADGERIAGSAITWKPSIHMPRWASRITLEITEVRVERLQQLTGKDVATEGFPFSSDLDQFKLLWNDLNAARGFGWDANPWVWVVSFRRDA